MPDAENPHPPKPASTPKPSGPPAPAGSPKPAARYDYGVDPVMADLLKTSAQATKQLCSKCNAFMKPDAVICTSCGWNKNTGRATSMRVVAEKKPKDDPTGKRGPGFLNWLRSRLHL